MRVAGLDLSLTATALATARGTGVLATPASKIAGEARLAYVRNWVLGQLVPGACTVFVEGYSYGSKNNREALGELGGVVRVALWEAGIALVTVPPKTLKIYGTGSGNADKTAMVVAARERLGLESTDDNAADAMWLYAMGVHVATGKPLVQLPKTHTRALDKVKGA